MQKFGSTTGTKVMDRCGIKWKLDGLFFLKKLTVYVNLDFCQLYEFIVLYL